MLTRTKYKKMMFLLSKHINTKTSFFSQKNLIYTLLHISITVIKNFKFDFLETIQKKKQKSLFHFDFIIIYTNTLLIITKQKIMIYFLDYFLKSYNYCMFLIVHQAKPISLSINQKFSFFFVKCGTR